MSNLPEMAEPKLPIPPTVVGRFVHVLPSLLQALFDKNRIITAWLGFELHRFR